jgi:hypothetical protein
MKMSGKPTKIALLQCKFLGHDFIEGPRYHNASISGSSKICQRCGSYEIILDGEEAAAARRVVKVKAAKSSGSTI